MAVLLSFQLRTVISHQVNTTEQEMKLLLFVPYKKNELQDEVA